MMSWPYLIGRASSCALDVRQGEHAPLAADQQGAGKLGMKAQQAGPWSEGHRVQQAGHSPQVKNLHQMWSSIAALAVLQARSKILYAIPIAKLTSHGVAQIVVPHVMF